jgi:hypothetical protein
MMDGLRISGKVEKCQPVKKNYKEKKMKRTLNKIALFSLTIALLLCCGFPALADGPSPCTQCILGIRPDILPNHVKLVGDTIPPIDDEFPPADDFPALADGPSPCTQCILSIRPDILPFYERNGWDISPENHNNIIDNWCGIDPPGCCAAKFNCDADCELCDVPSPCTQCILGIRPDILPFYERNGWDISPENQDNIIENWCGIDPAGCSEVKFDCYAYACWEGSVNCKQVFPWQVSDRPVGVFKANDPGCDDYFALYFLDDLPTKAGSYNECNIAHMLANNRQLNGYWLYAPPSESPRTYAVFMCVKHMWWWWWPPPPYICDGYSYKVGGP